MSQSITLVVVHRILQLKAAGLKTSF